MAHMTNLKTYGAMTALGMVAAMRSMSALRITLENFRRSPRLSGPDSPLPGLALSAAMSPTSSTALNACVVGEMIGDKLPIAPSRIAALPLIGRVGIGAIGGAVIAAAEEEPIAVGAAIGGAAALAASYVIYHLRRKLGESTGIPDPVIGLAEDAVVIGALTRMMP